MKAGCPHGPALVVLRAAVAEMELVNPFSGGETEAHKSQLKASGSKSGDWGLGPRFEEI